MEFSELLKLVRRSIGQSLDEIESYKTKNTEEEEILNNIHIQLEMCFTDIPDTTN